MATAKKTATEATTETVETAQAAKTIRVKVVKPFKDKETGKMHKVGEALQITEARYKEILSVGKFVRKA